MRSIFICYRRSDTSVTAGRLADYLRATFGVESVFYDRERSKAGDQWPDKLRKGISDASAVVVLIGPNWFKSHDSSGRRLIDRPGDWVREEILTSLKRKRDGQAFVLPCLAPNTPTPEPSAYPDELQPLHEIQYAKIHEPTLTIEFSEIHDRLIEHGFRVAHPAPPVSIMAPPDSFARLTEDELNSFVSENPGWHILEKNEPGASESVIELYRFFEFRTDELAWGFMAEVMEKGIRPYNHHPRMQFTYNRVEIGLTTFNCSHNPSTKDLRLALIIEGIYSSNYS